ncbi:MAG: chemotaxis protein CheW [Nitrospirae bacterium]|nr:chemotaxis protein CheW [Nitrospirota bacterium]
MDIAKIRKKAKEVKEAKEPKSSSGPQNAVEHATVKDVQGAVMTVVSEEPVKKEEQTKPPEKTASVIEPAAEKIEFLTFQLATEEFAFRVSDIEEILRFQRITNVPRVPDYILGITSLRGKIIPVIDLRKRFSIFDAGDTFSDVSLRKILILKGSKGLFGAQIDRVRGVIRILQSEISEPPAHLTEAQIIFVEGVVLHKNRFVSIINMEELIEMKG